MSALNMLVRLVVAITEEVVIVSVAEEISLFTVVAQEVMTAIVMAMVLVACYITRLFGAESLSLSLSDGSQQGQWNGSVDGLHLVCCCCIVGGTRGTATK
jgi:hypothetical protein